MSWQCGYQGKLLQEGTDAGGGAGIHSENRRRGHFRQKQQHARGACSGGFRNQPPNREGRRTVERTESWVGTVFSSLLPLGGGVESTEQLKGHGPESML